MTLKELYEEIGGDYDQALRVLRVEKLIDKHIRKFPSNPVFAEIADAAITMDATRLFESSHAIKGVCSNLGLLNIASVASEISEEFRPGNARKMTDGEVKATVDGIGKMFAAASDGIRAYEASL